MEVFLIVAGFAILMGAVVMATGAGRRNSHGMGFGSMKPTAPPPAPKMDAPKVLRCTYCQGTEFYEGPSGGMATNILCANPKCRHWFNACPAIGYFEDLNRVEPEAPKVIEATPR